MNIEEARVALNIGYFLLLFYAMRRGFNLADGFSKKIDAKLDLVINLLDKKGR